MEMTYHCRYERASRIQKIVETIGIGQVIKEKYDRNAYRCLTDTGIILIKDDAKTTIVTMYVATWAEAVAMYNGTKKIPSYLHKRIDRNQTFYTKDGKTIWK